ncbi:MAG TPA: 4Fe-4S binding protein [Bdellovibrionota bacterium]|nr:4Fe-4S binding protein [Bdellovibrionota bacterium]
MIRNGAFDVVIAAAPRVDPWPSIGVRSLSVICAEMGLSVGVLGGDGLTVRGVIPLPGTGALVIAEDVQRRIHRIHARSVVRVSARAELPDPFPGSLSQGVVPLATAMRLLNLDFSMWNPSTVILGTGNRALRFGSRLLDWGIPEVTCIESSTEWQAKRFAGWEVERRRFEMAGGKLIEGVPVKLTAKGPLRWDIRIRTAQGTRVLGCSRVVAAGPFRDLPGIREYPAGSFLYEFDQTAAETCEQDVEGWMLEEERGRWLAIKIVKALVNDLGTKREFLDRVYRKARARLKRYSRHKSEPFTPVYQGKWMSSNDSRELRAFAGVPKELFKKGFVASVECIEPISCNLCQTGCPEGAIEKGRVLIESKCTGCGVCLQICPSAAIAMLREDGDRSTSLLALPWRGHRRWSVGEFASLLNRRGEVLGSGRVIEEIRPGGTPQIVKLEVPSHLLWEARGLKRIKTQTAEDASYIHSTEPEVGKKVEIVLNGEKRYVRDQALISTALFEIGHGRPEDLLHCCDGSCGLCQVLVDGVKKLACQTKIHRGMSIQLASTASPEPVEALLCSCMGIAAETVVERTRQGNLQSAEAVLSVTHVGEGKCRGQRCMDPFKRVLLDQGLDVSHWIDWRFPWSQWVLTRN